MKHTLIYEDRSENNFTFPQWLWLDHVIRRRATFMFPAQMHNLGSQRFKDDREVVTVVTRCVITQDTDWYKQGMGKLALRYAKSLSFGEDCVGKPWESRKLKVKCFC
jgi:hypothetical protein